ncbi:transketolase family protein [Candidatus Micrarchaeota archaeon]|nr:transketolase family protein [Candidatus Micrarchaeota archaeon]
MEDMHLIDPLFEPAELKPSRDGFASASVEIGEKDQNVWVLTADVSGSTRANFFERKFPERFVQVGVAEQNMAGVAAGIASEGKTAFVSAYGVFSPGRNWDQIRVSICYNDVPVIFHGSHTGITVGPDGASHQALEDIAITRPIPNMQVLAPADAEEVRKAFWAAYESKRPTYIRTSREKMPVFTTENTPFTLGKANVYREGNDVAIFAIGPLVYESLKAARELEKENIFCAVIDMHTIKPIDKEAIIHWAEKTGLLVSIEDHQINGGLGSAIAEVLAENLPTPLKRHGMLDVFGESGTASDLLKKYSLDAEGIKKTIKEALPMKKR